MEKLIKVNDNRDMKKKMLLMLVLSILNISLLYGEDQEERLVRKSDSIFRMVNDKLVKLDNKAVTVKLKEGKVLSNNVKAIRSNVLGYIDVEVPTGTDIEDFVANLKSTGDYELVKYNVIGEIGISSNDTGANNQWHLDAINMFSTWNITTGGSNVKVAVIDNGFDCTHEDIGYGNDNYRNIDPTLGYDYYQMSSTSMTKKDHGTQVAGIISAKTNNGTGIAGVAGGFGGSGVTILPFCVTDGTSLGVNFGYVDDAICLAVDNGAKVINMSFGSNDTNLSHHTDIVDAIDYAYSHGVTLVSITHNSYDSFVWFPACYYKVIAVGAMNQNNQRCSFSNYGSGINLVAPGEDIYSTKMNNGYDYADGTSFAAPQVAGIVALMLTVNPALTPSQITSTLQNTCIKLSGYQFTYGWNNYVGYGLLNAYAAINDVIAHSIVGPSLIKYSTGIYSVEDLPNGFSVEWSLSDSYYNQYCLQQDFPSTNQCAVTFSSTHEMINGILTANIKYAGETLYSRTKTISATTKLIGHYTSGNISQDINYPYPLYVRAGTTVYITSPNLVGSTAYYETQNVAIPTSWYLNSTSGYLNVGMPANNNVPVIVYVDDSYGSHYTLYLVPTTGNFLNVSIDNSSNSIHVTITADNDCLERTESLADWVTNTSEMLQRLNWTLEIFNLANGEKVVTQNVSGKSISLNTSGWKRGIYAVRATIGKEVLTEKIQVK